MNASLIRAVVGIEGAVAGGGWTAVITDTATVRSRDGVSATTSSSCVMFAFFSHTFMQQVFMINRRPISKMKLSSTSNMSNPEKLKLVAGLVHLEYRMLEYFT